MSSNFNFLQPEWPLVFASAAKSESFVFPDPGTACIHARRTLELVMQWLFKSDTRLRAPYQQNLSALVHEPTFIQAAGQTIHAKARLIVQFGNHAAHAASRPVTQENALAAVRELFHVCFWMARTYARGARPADTLPFLPLLLPRTSPIPAATRAKLAELEASLSAKDVQLTELITGQAALDAELERLRAEVADARQRNEAVQDTHDYSEEQTRDTFIDRLLAEAGWDVEQPQAREYAVRGMPSESGTGYVDYVLWGRDGRPLGLVEAKRTRTSPHAGQQQAKLYADCLEQKFGQRPVIFYTNGYQHWMWDDGQYPPREVSGFYTHDELELLIERRETRRSAAATAINEAIAGRPYQQRAIRKIAERVERDGQRRALLVMATGSGKTRTIIALCDLLMRAGWVKRVLFLADRVALVKQATRAFAAHLPSCSPVNLVSERNDAGRVYVSTYPTMMKLIDERNDNGTRRFGTGYFDLVIVDEAHRSIYQKYAAIFDYFDSLLVGLTATPRSEIDRNTYRLFALEDGVPTDEYSLEQAIEDKYLVRARPVSVPLRFQREGIKYDDLSDEEKDQWDNLDWTEDGAVPESVEASALNQWLLNEDTVDKVLQHLMERGQKVEDGDRLGKTIVFARNHDHAEFIAKRFNANYPHYAGKFAQVIDNRVAYAQSLIDSFSQENNTPHIAISVDMMDTGIDVPEVVNLVFFKPIRSKTKFWQMVGRGTRLRPGLFGPGTDKKFFSIFDFCQNLEFFSHDPEGSEGSTSDSLTKRLFCHRVDLISGIDSRRLEQDAEAVRTLRESLVAGLRHEIAGMSLENFLVRPHRSAVERFANAEAWTTVSQEDQTVLKSEVAGLPSSVTSGGIEAKQFDLLALRTQLAWLRGDAAFTEGKAAIMNIARRLEALTTIPAVRAQLILIQEVQSDEFWQDVTLSQLEKVRIGLRDLVRFIPQRQRMVVTSDFQDSLGTAELVSLPGMSPGVDSERVRQKALHFLKVHEQNPAIHKLRWNEPLSAEDIQGLEAIFRNEGASEEEIESIREEEESFGLFLRSLSGLDRQAAKQAFAGFLAGRNLTPNQMEFTELVIHHLTVRGWVDPAQLYASPFTDRNPYGLDGIFDPASAQTLIGVLQVIRANATAASPSSMGSNGSLSL